MGHIARLDLTVHRTVLGSSIELTAADGDPVTVHFPGPGLGEPEFLGIDADGEKEWSRPPLLPPTVASLDDDIAWGSPQGGDLSFEVRHVWIEGELPDRWRLHPATGDRGLFWIRRSLINGLEEALADPDRRWEVTGDFDWGAPLFRDQLHLWADALDPAAGPSLTPFLPGGHATAARPAGLYIRRLPGDNPLDLPQVTFLLEKAAAMEALPWPWPLMVDARRQLYSDPRRAVVDVCTALEIACEDFIQSRLGEAGLPDAAVSTILGNLPGVASKVDLAQKLGGSLGGVSGKKVAAVLAGPRNKAAHAGEPPKQKVLTDAYKTGHLALSGLVPIHP